MRWVILKNDGEWLARCPAHNLTATGTSWEDLKATVRVITRDFLGYDEDTLWVKDLAAGRELGKT